MDIKVILSNSGDSRIPDGSMLEFKDVEKWDLKSTSDVQNITCAEAGCGGCKAVHRVLTGVTHLFLSADGVAANGPHWKTTG